MSLTLVIIKPCNFNISVVKLRTLIFISSLDAEGKISRRVWIECISSEIDLPLSVSPSSFDCKDSVIFFLQHVICNFKGNLYNLRWVQVGFWLNQSVHSQCRYKQPHIIVHSALPIWGSRTPNRQTISRSGTSSSHLRFRWQSSLPRLNRHWTRCWNRSLVVSSLDPPWQLVTRSCWISVRMRIEHLCLPGWCKSSPGWLS